MRLSSPFRFCYNKTDADAPVPKMHRGAAGHKLWAFAGRECPVGKGKQRMKPGLIHIYCGDGKGKTTASLGLCLRAAGHGKRVLLVQFLKTNRSGEREALKLLPTVTVLPNPERLKFTFQMNEDEKAAAAAQCAGQLEEAVAAAEAGACELLILDEAFGALSCGLLDRERLLSFLRSKPASLEVVLTGRDPDDDFLALADYISEVRLVRHPFQKGVPAREGIEQ